MPEKFILSYVIGKAIGELFCFKDYLGIGNFSKNCFSLRGFQMGHYDWIFAHTELKLSLLYTKVL